MSLQIKNKNEKKNYLQKVKKGNMNDINNFINKVSK